MIQPAYPEFDGSQPCAAADPEAWFPERGLMSDNRMAVQICHSCPFEAECRWYAVHHLVDGIWGGTTVPERRRIRARLGIKAQPMMLILSESADAIRARERRARAEKENPHE